MGILMKVSVTPEENRIPFGDDSKSRSETSGAGFRFWSNDFVRAILRDSVTSNVRFGMALPLRIPG